MTVDVELLLIVAIVAFFLKDSTMLLQSDEAVLVRCGRARWQAGFGWRRLSLGHREPYLCNPFTPHRAVIRLRWAMDGHGSPVADAATPDALLTFWPLIWTMWLLLFVLLPITLLLHLDARVPIVVVVLLYATIASALLLTWLRRRELSLEPRAFAMLAFECVVCAPLAVNLVRKLSLSHRVQEDFVHAATRLLDAPAQAVVRRSCLARLDEQIEAEADEGSGLDAMRQLRRQFVEEMP